MFIFLLLLSLIMLLLEHHTFSALVYHTIVSMQCMEICSNVVKMVCAMGCISPVNSVSVSSFRKLLFCTIVHQSYHSSITNIRSNLRDTFVINDDHNHDKNTLVLAMNVLDPRGSKRKVSLCCQLRLKCHQADHVHASKTKKAHTQSLNIFYCCTH